MTDQPPERPHPDAAPGTGATADGTPAPRPLSRRELREREGADGSGDAATGTPVRAAETVPSDTSRYAAVHYLVLALVAGVLGYLIWSLTTGTAPDASSAGPAVPLTSPSAPRTATQGEL